MSDKKPIILPRNARFIQGDTVDRVTFRFRFCWWSFAVGMVLPGIAALAVYVAHLLTD